MATRRPPAGGDGRPSTFVQPLPFSDACERNKGPILEVLRQHLPSAGLVLEIASGSGQHIAHFARALPTLTWQPSDPDPEARESIRAWIAEAQLPGVLPPLDLDVRSPSWPLAACDAMVCINMIHISPWSATEALFDRAACVLCGTGMVYLYGPYRVNGKHTAPSNEAFDAMLRRQNPAWGVRDLEQVTQTARRAGFELTGATPMPANNLSVVFHKMSHGHGTRIG